MPVLNTYNMLDVLTDDAKAWAKKIIISVPGCQRNDFAFPAVAQHLIHVPSSSMISKHNFKPGRSIFFVKSIGDTAMIVPRRVQRKGALYASTCGAYRVMQISSLNVGCVADGRRCGEVVSVIHLVCVSGKLASADVKLSILRIGVRFRPDHAFSPNHVTLKFSMDIK